MVPKEVKIVVQMATVIFLLTFLASLKLVTAINPPIKKDKYS
jgi:hypothetical protein